MAKVYQNIHTYFPFIYLVLVTTLYGPLYHSFPRGRPYFIVVLLLINMRVYRFYKNKTLVRNIVNHHTWRTMTISTFGILFQSVHEDIFENHMEEKMKEGIILSLIYLLLIVVGHHVPSIPTNDFLLYTHIVYLFLPIKKVWEINYYVYAFMVIMQTLALFCNITKQELLDNSIYTKPIMTSFQYLMMPDIALLAAIPHLYIIYYNIYLPEIRASREIGSIVEEQTNMVMRYSKAKDNELFGIDDEDEMSESEDVFGVQP